MLWLLLAESPDSRWVNGQMGEFQNRNADKTAVVGGVGGRALGNFRRFGNVRSGLALTYRQKIQQR